MTVDLPAPVSPTRATDSPGAISRSIPRSASIAGARCSRSLPRPARRVGEAHALEPDRALQLGGRDGLGGFGGERLECHQLADALDRHPGLLPGVEDLGELLDRGEEQVEVEDEGDEGAGGEVAARDEPGADAEHDGVADVAEELHEGEVGAHQPLRATRASR